MKKTTVEMGENIWKLNHWQGVNFQNIQTAHAPQNQKIKKMGKICNQTFPQRRHTDGQEKHEKIL